LASSAASGPCSVSSGEDSASSLSSSDVSSSDSSGPADLLSLVALSE